MAKKYLSVQGYVELDEDGMSGKLYGFLSPQALPGQPQNLRVVQFTAALVSLAWDDAGDALSWKVYRNGAFLITVSTPFHTDNTVVNATLYEYQVRAVNSGGDSALSGIVSVTTAGQSAPATPTGLHESEGSTTARSATLLWNAAADAAEWDVFRNLVYLGTTVSVPSYTDGTLVAGLTYSYQILARNSTGESALTAAVSITALANSPPEWTLGNLAGVIGQGFSINLNSACSDPDGHPLTYALISGSTAGVTLVGSNYNGTPTAAGSNPLTFRANDGFINVDVQITFVVTDPDVTAPTVPQNVVAVPTGSTVVVTWDASTDASGILHYRIFRNGQFINTRTGLQFTNNGVPDGTYTYSIGAVDASANANESAQGSAAPIVVSVPSPAPDTPISFVATPGDAVINLSWAAGPNGATPTSYDLNRATAAGGPWSANLLSGLVTSFSDTGRTNGVQYFYRIQAFNGPAPSPAFATANSIAGGEFPGVVVSTFENDTVGELAWVADPNWGEVNTADSNSGFIRSDATKARSGSRYIESNIDRDEPGGQSNERNEIVFTSAGGSGNQFPVTQKTVPSANASYPICSVMTQDVWIGFSVFVPATWKVLWVRRSGVPDFTEAPKALPVITQLHTNKDTTNDVNLGYIPYAGDGGNPPINIDCTGSVDPVTGNFSTASNAVPGWFTQLARNNKKPTDEVNEFSQTTYGRKVKLGEWTDWVIRVRANPFADGVISGVAGGYVYCWKKDSGDADFVLHSSLTGGVGYAKQAKTLYWKIGGYYSLWNMSTYPTRLTVDANNNEVRSVQLRYDETRFFYGNFATNAAGIAAVRPR